MTCDDAAKGLFHLPAVYRYQQRYNVRLARLADHACDYVGSLIVHRGYHVAVDLQRDGDIGVPESLLDDLRMDPVLQGPTLPMCASGHAGGSQAVRACRPRA